MTQYDLHIYRASEVTTSVTLRGQPPLSQVGMPRPDWWEATTPPVTRSSLRPPHTPFMVRFLHGPRSPSDDLILSSTASFYCLGQERGLLNSGSSPEECWSPTSHLLFIPSLRGVYGRRTRSVTRILLHPFPSVSQVLYTGCLCSIVLGGLIDRLYVPSLGSLLCVYPL